MYKRNFLLLGLFLIILLVSLYFANGMLKGLTKLNATDVVARQQAGYQKKANTKQNIPIVFIQGQNDSTKTFTAMIHKLQKKSNGVSGPQIIRIDPDNKAAVTGTLTPGKTGLIQIVFTGSNGTLKQQTEWLNTAFRYLKKNEKISRMSVVSHSTGGVAFVSWLEQSGTSASHPQTVKFVPVAAAFDGMNASVGSTATRSQQKQNSPLYQSRNRIPAGIKVLTVTGVVKSKAEGDGQVALRSAQFGKYLFPAKNYSEKIIYGSQAANSKLSENTEAAQLIADFLLNNKSSE